MPKPWEPGAVVLCDVRKDGSVWVRNEDLNKCLDRIAELEERLAARAVYSQTGRANPDERNAE